MHSQFLIFIVIMSAVPLVFSETEGWHFLAWVLK